MNKRNFIKMVIGTAIIPLISKVSFGSESTLPSGILDNPFYDMFKTPTNLHFLHYSVLDNNALVLDVGKSPISKQLSVDALWPIESNPNIQKAYQSDLGKLGAANILCNSIARKSRRSVGNILVVPNVTEQQWFIDQYKKFTINNIKVVIDPTLAPNELRATYWKKINTMVDGGIQISPEGFSYIPNNSFGSSYRDYFARGFL